jgi:hypothetical protein
MTTEQAIEVLAEFNQTCDPTADRACALAEALTHVLEEHAKMRIALLRVCDETDWCPQCNAHPSHGHRKLCIVQPGGPR